MWVPPTPTRSENYLSASNGQIGSFLQGLWVFPERNIWGKPPFQRLVDLNLSPNNNHPPIGSTNSSPPGWRYYDLNPRFSINEWSILRGRSKVFGFAQKCFGSKKSGEKFQTRWGKRSFVYPIIYRCSKTFQVVGLGICETWKQYFRRSENDEPLIPNKLPMWFDVEFNESKRWSLTNQRKKTSKQT